MGEYTGFRDGSYTNEIGATLAFLRQFRPGYFTGMAVAQRGAGANMSVDVAIGDGLISGTDRAFPVFINTAAKNVVITTANATNARKDIIVAYVDLSVVVNNPATPNAPGSLKLLAVAGTPAGTPVDPSDGTIQTAVGASNPWIKLSRVLVDASAGSIVTAKCTDLRTRSGLATNRLYGGASNTAGHLVPNIADDTVALLAAVQALTNKTVGNTNVVASDSLSNPYKFSAYRAAAWTAGGVYTKVAFDTELFDTGSNFDAVTNSRFTAPIAGFYSFSASVQSNAAAGALHAIALYKNGALQKRVEIENGANTTPIAAAISGLMQLAASDYVEVWHQGSTSAGGIGADRTFFDGFLMSET